MLPANIILVGAENLMFLLFPSRTVAFSPGDFQVFGKQMLLILLKAFTLGAASSIAAGFGMAAYFLFNNLPIALTIAWIVLTILSLSVIPATTWAYSRFDVSLDNAT